MMVRSCNKYTITEIKYEEFYTCIYMDVEQLRLVNNVQLTSRFFDLYYKDRISHVKGFLTIL